MTDIKAFAGVARAPFLLLPVTLIAAGAAAGAYDGSFDIVRTIVALVGLVALHMAVNILNEWSDMRTGIDLKTRRTPFSGGSGTLPAGAISLRTTLVFGLTCAAVGLAAGVWLLTQIGTALIPFMVVGAFFVLGYTAGLARVGLGEIAAGLGLGGLPVAGTALVQGGAIGAAAVAAAIPATFMTFNLLLLNEFPDEEADRSGGRRNQPDTHIRQDVRGPDLRGRRAGDACIHRRRRAAAGPAAIRACRGSANPVVGPRAEMGVFRSGATGAHTGHGGQRQLESRH